MQARRCIDRRVVRPAINRILVSRVHASVTLTASGTAASASPMCPPSYLSLSFNRLLRILFLDRANIA